VRPCPLILLIGLSACGAEAPTETTADVAVAAPSEKRAEALSRSEIVVFCREAQLRHPDDADAQLLMINRFAADTGEPQRVAELCTTYAQGAADAAQELAADIERRRARSK
jgi:hypothetical protein